MLLLRAFFYGFKGILLRHPKNLVIYYKYHKAASTSPSHLEAHTGLFRFSMKGKFVVYRDLLGKSSFPYFNHDFTIGQKKTFKNPSI